MASKEAAFEKCDVANEKSSNYGSSVKLRRELGLFSAVNLILGVMIGSGIFVSPASALEHSGSVALCLIIWTVSGMISLLGALSFAELGTVLGKSGAEYSYFQEAFGNIHKYWGPLPSFICAWIYVVILRPAEVAIIVMTFAEYAIQPFTADLEAGYKDTAIKLASLAALSRKTKIKVARIMRLVFLLPVPAGVELEVPPLILKEKRERSSIHTRDGVHSRSTMLFRVYTRGGTKIPRHSGQDKVSTKKSLLCYSRYIDPLNQNHP